MLLSVFAITAAQAQQAMTLAQCQGDTVAFVKRNFVEGKARFIGQPFSKVIDEWRSQIPVGRILFADTGNWPTKESEKYLVKGASLQFITENDQKLRGLHKEPYLRLVVKFNAPYYQKIDTLWSIQEQEGIPFGPQLYEQIKDYVIQDISVFEMK